MKISLLALTCALLLPLAATASPRPAVSDEVMESFIRAYRDDPAALMQHVPLIRHASVEQMRHTIQSLGLTHFTYLYPMVIPGAELAKAHSMPLDKLSVMAVRGGKLIPIPFQFDEFNSDGLIWIDGQTPGQIAGQRGKLDAFDELVFMYRDGGEQRYRADLHGKLQGSLLQEIRLDVDGAAPRYVYLVKDHPGRSKARYVDVNMDEGRIESTVMRMHFDRRNLLGIHHVESLVGPHAGENVFDNIHITLSTGILNRNLRFSLDTENNIRVVPRAVAAGPVRNTMLLRVRIWYLGMPTIVSQDVHVHFYEQGAVIPIPFAIDSIGSLRHFVSLLREPRFELNVDFHKLDGAQVTFDSVYRPDQQGNVDGWMTDFEVGMNYARMPGDWLHLDSGRGWQMFFVNGMPLVEGGLFDQFMEGTELGMVYRDDRELRSKAMRYEGTLPRLGFRLNGMPTPAMDLLAASPKLPRRVTSLGEAIHWLGEDPSRLSRYDEAANRMLTQLKQNGLITTPEQLADAFITDMSRMHFSGLPREQLDSLIRDAIRTTVTDVGQVRHGDILATMVRLAKERKIPLRNLRHAHIQMALWFPDATGDQGPTGFHREVTNAPRPVIKPAPQLAVQ
jgi:hypothetical protein